MSQPDVAAPPAAHPIESERDLLLEIHKEAKARLWHLDRQVWTKRGVVTRCLTVAVRGLCALLSPARAGELVAPVSLPEGVADWSETGLSWAEIVALADIVQDRTIVSLGPASCNEQAWPVQAVISSLKAEIAGVYLRQQEEAIARQRDDSVASRHLAGRFLANASHELRTPLTAVLGFSELLLEDTYGELSEAQRTAVGHIENSAQNLHEIVNNLLDLMQFRSGKLEMHYRRIAIAPLLQHIYAILGPLANCRKVLFAHQVPDDLGSMDADEGILRHIVYHLLESALRATPEGGEVTLKAERTDDLLTIVGFDTALHFPRETIENMNDAFPIIENSPARGYDGWEIGFPLVRRYVDLHAGTLAIESGPDRGTTITVRLPTDRLQSAR